MTGLRGVLIGALTLIAIQTVVSTSGAAKRTAGAFHDLAGLIEKLVDPSVPLFADHTQSQTTTSTAATTVDATYHQNTGAAVNTRATPPARGLNPKPPAYSV